MRWPFGNRNRAPASTPPITVDDLRPRSRLPARGPWTEVPPLLGSAAPASSSPLTIAALAAAGNEVIRPPRRHAPAVRPAALPVRRVLPARGPTAEAGSLVRFVGDPLPVQPYADPAAGGSHPAFRPAAPPVPDGDNGWDGEDMAEELPPPIFSALLAERTGQDLRQLRPDWTGPVPGEDWTGPVPGEGPEAEPRPVRRRSLAESRRLGLGVPLHSSPDGSGGPDLRSEPGGAGSDSAPPVEAEMPPVAAPDRPPPEPEPPIAPAPPPEPAPEPSAASEPEPEGGLGGGAAAVRYGPAATPSDAAAWRQPVPPDLRHQIARLAGVDLGDRFVRRDPAASAEAAALGARAFTRGGEIVLPREAGPIDDRPARGLVAHELTHLAQQELQRGRMPDPGSAAGRRLEAEARAVERFVRHDDAAPRLVPSRTLPVVGDASGVGDGYVHDVVGHLVASGAAALDAEGTLVFRPPSPAGPGGDEVWPATADEVRADTELRQAAEEDLRASRQWEIDRGAAFDDAERNRLDAQEQERHRQFVKDFGERLSHAVGTGTPAAGAPDAAAAQVAPAATMAAHQSFAGLFGEGLGNIGLGAAVGQFGRRGPGPAPGDFRGSVAPVSAAPPAAATPTTATPTTAATKTGATTAATTTAAAAASATGASAAVTSGRQPTRSGAPSAAAQPVDLPAHMTFSGLFGEGLGNLGLGAAVGQFGRRGPAPAPGDFRGSVAAAPVATTSATGTPAPVPALTAATPATTAVTPAAIAVAPGSAASGSGPPATASGPPATASGLPATASGLPATASGPGGAGAAVAGGALVAGALLAAHHGDHPARRPGERDLHELRADAPLSRLDPADLEELAGLLYGRFHDRLRRELLIDRERSGLLTDFR